ncbi:TetR/AcrR family transcriptional regulator [Lachnospiraceae bacterium 62-35]
MEQIIEKKKQDRRCRKTVDSIKTALLTMLVERPLSDISISELAEYADINRKTFYNHYSGLQDVLAEIEDEMSSSIFDVLRQENFLADMGNPRPFFDALSARLMEQKELYRIMMRSGIEAEIFTKIKAWAREYIYQILSKNFPIDSNIFHFYLNVILSQISAAYKEWFCSDDPAISMDELSGFICSQVLTSCRFLADLSDSIAKERV